MREGSPVKRKGLLVSIALRIRLSRARASAFGKRGGRHPTIMILGTGNHFLYGGLIILIITATIITITAGTNCRKTHIVVRQSHTVSCNSVIHKALYLPATSNSTSCNPQQASIPKRCRFLMVFLLDGCDKMLLRFI